MTCEAETTSQAPSTSEVIVVPTPHPTTCPTPGTYTIPATTITVKKTTTVCDATSTKVPSGTHTVGGVTTVVVTATTVTCPVATVETSGTVTTSTIRMTEYVCPSAGTYTIAPITTTVTEETVLVYPTPSVCNPGTYTAPEKVVTVTKTQEVVYCPFTSKGLPTSTPAPVKSQAPPPPPPASTKVAPKPQPSKAPSNNNKGLTSDNDAFAMTYTPYEPSNGACKTGAQVDADIAAIKGAGIDTVRVYSTDCGTLDTVGSACDKHGVSMIVGVFVKASGCSINTPEIAEQVKELSGWKGWSKVKLVVVGNEAIMNNFCTPQQLKQLVIDVKSACHSQFPGPYTISETLNVWQRGDVSSAICGVVDVTGANIHPYFNGQVTPDSAGDFVQSQLDLLANICPGHDVINLECGWPGEGNCNGEACAGPSEQAAAIKSIRKKCGNKTVFFSFTNDFWKDKGSCGCEQSWGAAKAFSININISI